MKITTTWLEARREARNRPKKRSDVTVDGREGLMVRIFPSGAVTFRFRYTFGSKRRIMVLGEFGDGGLSLADAFDMHHVAQRELEKGLDPIEERQRRQDEAERARQDQAAAGTVNSIVEQFVHRRLCAERWDAESNTWVRDQKSNTKPRKRPGDAAALLGYRLDPGDAPKRRRTRRKPVTTLLSKYGSEKARKITKSQLVALLDEIVDRGSPVMANRVYALLKQLFEFAAGKDLIPASPMAGIAPPGGDEKPRKRKLTSSEIKTIWEKLPTAAMAKSTKAALKLLLVTGQRRGELTFSKKAYFDLGKAEWTIPPELQKTEDQTKQPTEPHVVPLTPLAVQLVEELFALSPNSEWILPSQYRKKKADSPYSARALTRAVAKNEVHFGIPHWRPHDLRRACRTGLSRLKVSKEVAERVINHARPKLDETYDQHDFLSEKREALEKWATHLQAVIEGPEPTATPAEVESA
jgi:integrase